MSVGVRDEVDQFIDLLAEIERLEEQLKDAKQRKASLEAAMVEMWAAVGKQSENRRGLTIYRSREFFCTTKAGESGSLKESLEDEGLGEMVRPQVAMASLKSWIKERVLYDDQGNLDFSQVPEAVASKLHVFEQFALRARKSS